MQFQPRRVLLFPATAFIFFLSAVCYGQVPLHLDPDNRHYFEYRGKSLLLITTAEDYGALANPAFDYIRYLDALKSGGMNSTRLFSGVSVWIAQKGRRFNTSGEVYADHFYTPWPRSEQPGYIHGGNKFDLDKWDEAYFNRLKDLLTQASRRGIFVELTLFGNNYDDSIWINSPLYPQNNVQGIGPSGKNSFALVHTLKDARLLERQEAFVKKIITETNAFDNLYYEVCNEPYNEMIDTLAIDTWHRHMVHLIKETESLLPKKHLIAVNESIVDDADVSIANYHYVHVANMPDFDWLYNLNKALSMDETLIIPFQCDINDVRVEAWDFILRGGAGYNNLNWEYSIDHEAGSPLSEKVCKQLHLLQWFMSTFAYTRMCPDKSVIIKKPANCFVRVLSEKSRQYAIYLHHSMEKGKGFITGYRADKRQFKDDLTLSLPAGEYILEWINPSTGKLLGKKEKLSFNEDKKLSTPIFFTDIAARLVRQPE